MRHILRDEFHREAEQGNVAFVDGIKTAAENEYFHNTSIIQVFLPFPSPAGGMTP
jgi:hypothetical protein